MLGGTVDGAYAWVHSRKGSDGLHVSTQKLICTNPVYADYTQTDTRALASSSYGAKGNVVLNPGTTASGGNSGTGSSGNGGTTGGSTGDSGADDDPMP